MSKEMLGYVRGIGLIDSFAAKAKIDVPVLKAIINQGLLFAKYPTYLSRSNFMKEAYFNEAYNRLVLREANGERVVSETLRNVEDSYRARLLIANAVADHYVPKDENNIPRLNIGWMLPGGELTLQSVRQRLDAVHPLGNSVLDKAEIIIREEPLTQPLAPVHMTLDELYAS